MKKAVPYYIGAGKEQRLIFRSTAVLCLGKNSVKGGLLR